jgi:hypothetical protein
MPGKSNKFARLTMVNGQPVGRRYGSGNFHEQIRSRRVVSPRKPLCRTKIGANDGHERVCRTVQWGLLSSADDLHESGFELHRQ